MNEEAEEIEGLKIINGPTRSRLSELQLVDYKEYKTQLMQWLLNEGKNPERAEGYASSTVRQVSQKTDRFYRWLWSERGSYTTGLESEDAAEFMDSLVYAEEDYSNSHLASFQKCLKRLFKWQAHKRGASAEWDPDRTFPQSSMQAPDYLTLDERKTIREAALSYGSVPAYNGLTPKDRDRWRTHLAQRFGRPKSEIVMVDWERANGWKIPSLTWVSLDAGFRPVEIGRAKTSWVDLEKGILRIPREDSSKTEGNWSVSLRDRTVDLLEKWLAERETREKYDDSDRLWLTRNGKPYSMQSLNGLLDRVCETAEIPTEGRDVTWYSISHSVGTYMAREEGQSATVSTAGESRSTAHAYPDALR